eukprot:s382_g33.t1
MCSYLPHLSYAITCFCFVTLCCGLRHVLCGQKDQQGAKGQADRAQHRHCVGTVQLTCTRSPKRPLEGLKGLEKSVLIGVIMFGKPQSYASVSAPCTWSEAPPELQLAPLSSGNFHSES